MTLLLGIIYLSFISLGLPDAILGAAWPNMYPEFQVSVSYAGIISMIISIGTILSSINSDRLIRKFGTGIVTTVSIGITAMICFCCYCGIEQTTMLWMSSYLNLTKGVAVHTAAMLSGIFCMGITAGCGINGFIAMRLKDNQMIRIGQLMIAIGITIILVSMQSRFLFLGLLLLGLGCAPVYPSMIHLTPEYFGIEHSQAIIGVQMASAYSGTCFIPLLFGWISKYIAIQLLPMYLLILLIIMIYMNERLSRNVDYISSSQIIYKK